MRQPKTEPRFMAQPPLLPKGEFDPSLPPSPVQIAERYEQHNTAGTGQCLGH